MSGMKKIVKCIVLYTVFTAVLLVSTAFGVYLFLSKYTTSLPGGFEGATFRGSFPWVLFIEGLIVVIVGSMRTAERTILPLASHLIARTPRVFMKPPPTRYDWLLIFVGITLSVVGFYLMFAWNI